MLYPIVESHINVSNHLQWQKRRRKENHKTTRNTNLRPPWPVQIQIDVIETAINFKPKNVHKWIPGAMIARGKSI